MALGKMGECFSVIS